MGPRVFKAVLRKILEGLILMFESFLLRNALCSFFMCRASSRGFAGFVFWLLLLLSSCSADSGPSQVSASTKLLSVAWECFHQPVLESESLFLMLSLVLVE